MGRQMTAIAGAPIGGFRNWKSIHWKTIYEAVKRLQMRIAKAVKVGRYGRAKALQWLLTHSYHAKLLAVKRVTSNKGKRTPGVDNVTWKTARQKFQAAGALKRRGYQPSPLRRIYIPKKNGKKRPLSIPTMIDRAVQALYKLALEPIAETLADLNSYGFRSYRRCADAISQCFITLAKKASPVWVLEADIKACFDEISHKWMVDHVPMDKMILTKWLAAGFMENGKLFPTGRGTPQGGIASPILANMVLDGIEETAKSVAPVRDRRNGKDISCKHPGPEGQDVYKQHWKKSVAEITKQIWVVTFTKKEFISLVKAKEVVEERLFAMKKEVESFLSMVSQKMKNQTFHPKSYLSSRNSLKFYFLFLKVKLI